MLVLVLGYALIHTAIETNQLLILLLSYLFENINIKKNNFLTFQVIKVGIFSREISYSLDSKSLFVVVVVVEHWLLSW